MTEIEQKALALVNEVAARLGITALYEAHPHELAKALCRAIEQHDAFRREVSDAASLAKHLISEWVGSTREDGERAADYLTSFIIPKPVDPLAECLAEAAADPDQFRAAMKARGYEFTKIGEAGE